MKCEFENGGPVPSVEFAYPDDAPAPETGTDRGDALLAFVDYLLSPGDLNATGRKVEVIAYFLRRPGAAKTAGTLAKRLGVSPSRVNQLLSKNRDFVQKKRRFQAKR